MNGEGVATRLIWAAGNYEVIARRLQEASERVVRQTLVEPGERVLDVGCGTGNAAIAAALAGGEVTAVDIVPEMFETGRRRAEDAQVAIEWIEADTERLPFDDESFDVVISVFGCMFAPHHKLATAEMVRVLRPGGRVAVASWAPSGTAGDLFRTITDHAPARATGLAFQPPTLWGVPEHVDELFAAHQMRLYHHFEILRSRFDSPEQAADEYMNNYGPIVMLRKMLEPLGRWDDFYEDLKRTLTERALSEGDQGLVFDSDYLLSNGWKPG